MCSFFSSGKNEERAWSPLAKREWNLERNPKAKAQVAVAGTAIVLLSAGLSAFAIYSEVGTNKPNTTNTTID